MTEFSNDLAAQEGGLKKTLGAAQITMIAIGGAIGTGLFLGSGFAIGTAGPSVLVSYAIGAVIALLLMGCLAEMSIAHPTSGSFGVYAGHYVSPLAGFLVRYAYWTCVVLAVGTEVTAVGMYMKYWFPGVPAWIWIVVFSAALIAINASSVSSFGWVEYGFSMVKIAAIVAFILIGAWVVFGTPQLTVADGAVGFQHYTAHGGFMPKGWWGTWVAVIISIFSYLGVEMIAVASGEALEPEKSIRNAFRSTILRLVVFYLCTLALMLAIVPWTGAGEHESPFVTVMKATGISGAAGVVNFVVLVAALSAMNSQLYIATRMMFSLSRAGYAPKAFGEVSRRGVPLRALMLSTLGMAVATLVTVLIPDTSFTVMMAIAIFGALFTWMMIFVTHWCFRRHWQAHGRQPLRFRMWGFPVLTLLGAMLMLAILVTTAFTAPFRLTLVTGVPFLALLTVVYFVWYRGKPVAKLNLEY